MHNPGITAIGELPLRVSHKGEVVDFTDEVDKEIRAVAGFEEEASPSQAAIAESFRAVTRCNVYLWTIIKRPHN